MDPNRIRCVMEATEYVFCEDRMATRKTFPLLTDSQYEQVQVMYDSAYWHKIFVLDRKEEL